MGIFSEVDVMPVARIGLLCPEGSNACRSIFMLTWATGLLGFKFCIQLITPY